MKSWRAAALALAVCLPWPAGAARAASPFLELPEPRELERSPAHRYANLTNDEALAELRRRRIGFVLLGQVRGVRLPIRLASSLSGVHVHSSLPTEQRAESPFEVLDARLALALDDFCRLLASHDVVELVHFTMYRPGAAHQPETFTPQSRHPGGMAIDVGALRKRHGGWLTVRHHWPAAVGNQTCGPGAPELTTRAGRELLSVVCEAADLRLFHYMLTPHFDAAHHDHLHLEIKAGVSWFLAH